MNLLPSRSQAMTIGYTLVVLALVFRVQAASDLLTGQ